ncbi:MAG TPA: lytic transglycosylase domain-containing protein [Pyrinomonadaceae bacterium]|nr:lytic transglycosylase domain-containing protein [Pyrinomonadaceae bacterium]
MDFKRFQPTFQIFTVAFVLIILTFSLSCSAFEPQQSEEQALQFLRQMMKDGKLPPESAVLQIESRFSNTKTGALCKLLRAQIRLTGNDFNGAAEILNSNVFAQNTTVGDYALWLRGKALSQAGRFGEAQIAFEKLTTEFPTSLRYREGKLLWANAAVSNGQAGKVPDILKDLIAKNDADALLAVAKSFETQGNQAQATVFYRRTYFYGAGSNASKEAEAKLNPANPLVANTVITNSTTTPNSILPMPLMPSTQEEAQVRADKLLEAKNYAEAQKAFDNLFSTYSAAANTSNQFKRLTVFSNLKKMSEAQIVFNGIPATANEKLEGYNQLARGYANARMWEQAKTTLEEMRRTFPNNPLTPKTVVAVGMIARDQKNKADESYLLQSALTNYPNAVEVAQAQFELAWLQHDTKNFALSSQMLTEHLGRYADKDTTNRGKAGYWSARDSERAGKINEACALYDALIYRYNSNWYGYLASQRLASLKALNNCKTPPNFGKDSIIGKAINNLKSVTVAPETSTIKEQERFGKAEQLSIIGLFDWAIEELNSATKTASNSPKVNLAIAKLYRLRGDNTGALLALARSYPDYSQMFPEEMGKEEWDIFYPLSYWDQIKNWSKNRNLEPYQVAGFIRQETVFSPRAKSGANAYGLMQLLIPTARILAKKYGNESPISPETLFQPALNIELGTAYIRDMYDKFGRVEYVAIAYNAGPGRVPQWQSTLPFEMDEFVEAIPFKETKGYVQGIIRNSAQYRRLYDENGNFKPNVGTKPIRNAIDTQTRERVAQDFPDVVIDDSKNGDE